MSKLPYMPFAVDAYIGDTLHLSLEEHGAYLLLLMFMWRRNGSIPDDDRDNARMLGLQPEDYLRIKPRLMPFLIAYGPKDGRVLTQKRLQREWNRALERSHQQSEKGKRGVQVRIERKQILSSIPRSSNGLTSGSSHGISSGLSPTSSPAQANKQERKNTTISQEETAAATGLVAASPVGAAPAPSPELPEARSNVEHLLETPLMRRTAR